MDETYEEMRKRKSADYKRWLAKPGNAEKTRDRLRSIDPKKKREYRALWKAKNPGKTEAAIRRWRRAHPESDRAYKIKNRDRDRHLNRSYCQKRRAKKKSAAIGDTNVILAWEKSWRGKRAVTCYWCMGRYSPKKCHSDHIVALSLGGAHSVENLCISCARCNLAKHDKTAATWNQAITNPTLFELAGVPYAEPEARA